MSHAISLTDDPHPRIEVSHQSEHTSNDGRVHRHTQVHVYKNSSKYNAADVKRTLRGIERVMKRSDQIIVEVFSNRCGDENGYMFSFTTISASEAPKGYRPWWSRMKLYRALRREQLAAADQYTPPAPPAEVAEQLLA